MKYFEHNHPHSAHHLHHFHEHPDPRHDRRNTIRLTLDEEDRAMLLTVFPDRDSAAAAEDIFYCEAPPEVRFLIIQNLKAIAQIQQMIQTVPQQKDEIAEETKIFPAWNEQENRARWNNSVLDDNSESLFCKLYGEAGVGIHHHLEMVPYEMALVARIQAYLNEKVGELNGQY